MLVFLLKELLQISFFSTVLGSCLHVGYLSVRVLKPEKDGNTDKFTVKNSPGIDLAILACVYITWALMYMVCLVWTSREPVTGFHKLFFLLL